MTNKNKRMHWDGAVDVPANTKRPLTAQSHVAFPLNLLEQILLTHLRDHHKAAATMWLSGAIMFYPMSLLAISYQCWFYETFWLLVG